MPNRGLNLHQLRLFCKVAEHRSFSIARQRLFLSQPALSNQVRQLEQSLGLQLISRSGKGFSLTRAGEEFYLLAKDLLERVDAVERRVSAMREGREGTIILGVSPGGALTYMMDIINAFRQESPDISVNIEIVATPQLVEEMRYGRIDIGVGIGRLSTQDFVVVHELAKIEFGFVASGRRRFASDEYITKSEIEALPFISAEQPGAAHFTLRLANEFDIHPPEIIHLQSIEAIKKLVEADRGITRLSRLAVKQEVEDKRLAFRQMVGLESHSPIKLAVPRTSPPVLSQFVSFAINRSKATSVETLSSTYCGISTPD